MSPNKKKDEETVKKWVESFFSYMDSNDFDKFISLMADDFIYLPPNRHSIYGKEAVAELMRPWFETLSMTHEIIETDIVTDNNIAYASAQWRERYTPKEGGEITVHDCKGLSILQRDTDKSWLVKRMMWNHNPSSEEHP